MADNDNEEPKETPPTRVKGRGFGAFVSRWTLPLLALGAISVIAWVLWGKLRDEVWAYFTDEDGTRVEVQEDKARKVLWEDPKPNRFHEGAPAEPGEAVAVNDPTGRLEAAFSADGTMMILVRCLHSLRTGL